MRAPACCGARSCSRVSDRLTTLGGALLALLLMVALVYQPQQQQQAPRPLSNGAAGDGYLGAWRWLQQSRVPVISLRKRFAALQTREDLPPAGNILLTTVPHLKPFHDRDAAALAEWVERGNTLVVMAALNETPRWITPLELPLQSLRELTGMSFKPVLDDEDEVLLVTPEFSFSATPPAPLEIWALPQPEHPLLQDVERLRGISPMATQLWQPRLSEEVSHVAELAQLQDYPAAALWQRRRGQGFIIISAFASLFTNSGLAAADNAQLLSNLLRFHLGPGGAVVFDDFHQGLSDLYDPQAFFTDSRLLISVTFVILFWLIYLLGTSARIAPVRPAPAVPTQKDLITALGGFVHRKLKPADAGRLLVENWLQQLHGSGSILLHRPAADAGYAYAEAWPQLQGMPLLQQDKVARVQHSYRKLCAGGQVDIKQLRNQLLDLQRALK